MKTRRTPLIVAGDSELCQKVFASWSFFSRFPLKSIMWRKLDIDPALAWRHSVAAGTRFKVTRSFGSVFSSGLLTRSGAKLVF